MELIVKNRKGEEFTILYDECDHETVSKRRWFVDVYKVKNKAYARTSVRIAKGVFTTIKMHRMIMGVTDQKVLVDHRNGNGLDNRRENIRICTYSQNSMNRFPNRTSKHGTKGVIWHKSNQSWCARISINCKLIHLGSFKSFEAAKDAYNEAAINMFGEFARINP